MVGFINGGKLSRNFITMHGADGVRNTEQVKQKIIINVYT